MQMLLRQNSQRGRGQEFSHFQGLESLSIVELQLDILHKKLGVFLFFLWLL